MARMSVVEIRDHMADALNRVAYQSERIVLHRRGRDVAVIVPVEDYEALEAVENKIDLEKARKALAQAKARGEKAIPFDQVEREMDALKARGRSKGRA